MASGLVHKLELMGEQILLLRNGQVNSATGSEQLYCVSLNLYILLLLLLLLLYIIFTVLLNCSYINIWDFFPLSSLSSISLGREGMSECLRGPSYQLGLNHKNLF